jgi:hypothetical protein
VGRERERAEGKNCSNAPARSVVTVDLRGRLGSDVRAGTWPVPRDSCHGRERAVPVGSVHGLVVVGCYESGVDPVHHAFVPFMNFAVRFPSCTIVSREIIITGSEFK